MRPARKTVVDMRKDIGEKVIEEPHVYIQWTCGLVGKLGYFS